MMPAAPAATRSSITAAGRRPAACSGYLNCRSYLGSSPCAFFTPASAIFQKSDAPLTTKASTFLSAAFAGPRPSAIANAADIHRNQQTLHRIPPIERLAIRAANSSYC